MDDEFERTFGKSASRNSRDDDAPAVPELPDNNALEAEGESDLWWIIMVVNDQLYGSFAVMTKILIMAIIKYFNYG